MTPWLYPDIVPSQQLAGTPERQYLRQFRFPRSKRKRIRKKWASKDCNYKTVIVPATPDMGPYMYTNPFTGRKQVVCSPAHYSKLMEEIAMLERAKRGEP